MKDEGFILLWRRFFDHRYWTKRRKFSEAEAWIDMIAMASFRAREVLIGRTKIQLDRGEFLGSIRYLERRWKWGRDRVHTFLKDAQTSGEIRAKIRTPEGYTYAIVKYDDYQLLPDSKPDNDRTTIGQNRIKVIKEKKETDTSDSRLVFEYWVQKTGRDPARTRLTKEREAKIKTRLERFSVEELKSAIDGVVASEFHRSNPTWTDLTSCFATDTKVEQHLERASRTPNGHVRAGDLRRCVQLGGSDLTVPIFVERGFRAIEEREPELWKRVKPIAPGVDWVTLNSVKDNEFQFSRALTAEVEKASHAD